MNILIHYNHVNNKISDQLLTHYRKREFWIDVDVANINVYDELLGSLLQSKPAEVLPQVLGFKSNKQ